jgi:hypothetical protein
MIIKPVQERSSTGAQLSPRSGVERDALATIPPS